MQRERVTFMKQEEYASFVNSPHLCNVCVYQHLSEARHRRQESLSFTLA